MTSLFDDVIGIYTVIINDDASNDAATFLSFNEKFQLSENVFNKRIKH